MKIMREDTRMFAFEFFQNCPFWTYIKDISTFIFLVHAHSSWFIFSLHLVRGPKTLQIDFFKGSYRKSQTMKSDHGKRPSSMVQRHGPWYKPALHVCKCWVLGYVSLSYYITPWSRVSTWLYNFIHLECQIGCEVDSLKLEFRPDFTTSPIEKVEKVET